MIRVCTVRVFLCLPFAALLAGCVSPIGVQNVGVSEAQKQIHANALATGTPSVATRYVLHRFNLTERFNHDAHGVIQVLQEQACRDRRRDIVLALAELNFVAARRGALVRGTDGTLSNRPLYLASAVYAYLYLFGDFVGQPGRYDREIGLARDLYNRGVLEGFRGRTREEIIMDPATFALPVGTLRIKTTQRDPALTPERVKRVWFADDFVVRGLSRRTRDHGLGVPLIVQPSEQAASGPGGKFMNPGRQFPATAFLRLQGDLCALADGGALDASLELYQAAGRSEIEVGNERVPLERDFTAPLAHQLEKAMVWDTSFSQFFSAEEKIKSGIYLVTPYQRGKVPILFVHGTASNPAYWAEMLNTFASDPELRARYQAWYFIYNTGNPILYTAANLRTAISNVVSTLDPEGTDPALRQIVLVGHSQGGLVSRLVVSTSGDVVWSSLSTNRFDDVKMDAGDRELLRRSLFFEPSPFVSRVVFISTPHGGSRLVKGFVQSLAFRFIKLPGDVLNAGQRVLPTLLGGNTEIPPQLRRFPTSIANMKPGSPFVENLAKMPLSPNVQTHSIIAVKGSGPPEEGNDGVVAYPSAHITGAESEFVVRWSHSCQSHPLVIEEVRRILLEHYRPPAQPPSVQK